MHAKLLVPIYLKLFQTLVFKSFPTLWIKKIPSFNLARPNLGNFLQRNSKRLERCLAIKFFINPSLICNGSIKLYRDVLKEYIEYFSFQVHMNSLLAILLFHVCAVARQSHKHKKQQCLVNTLCNSINIPIILRSPRKLHW